MRSWREFKPPQTPEQQESYHKIWVATYAAFFASQVQAHIDQGRDGPYGEHFDRFAEEAEFVAEEAAQRGWSE
jgi:hypothetical protein